MQIHEITLAKKNNATSYAWGGYGFDLRSDVIWPDLAYRKTRIAESQDFDSWLAKYAKNVTKPQPGDECILTLLTHQANPMGPVQGFYGPATYVDETDQYYVLQISTGKHKYWKNNQIVFANKQDFEKFKVMLSLKFGENFKGLEQTEVQESRDARTPTHVSEGLLDTVKSGIKSAATGAAKTVAPMVYGDNIKPDWLSSASNKSNLTQAEKLRQQINNKYGVNVQGSKPKTLPPTAATGIPPAVPLQVPHGQQLAGWANLPGGVQIKPAAGKNPTLAKYKKNLYSLSNNGQWVNQNGRPVNVTISAFLDQALEQM